MRRDLNLVREILMRLEDHGDPLDWAEITVEGRSAQEISYHVMVMHQGGLVAALDCSDSDGFEWVATSMTWDGHEFLDAARNSTIWRKALALIGATASGVSFDVLVEVLKHEALRALGIAAQPNAPT